MDSLDKGNEFLQQTLTVSPLYLEPDVVDLWYFKLWMNEWLNSLSLKYHRFTASGCKDIEIGKFELVAKTQFLWIKSNKVHKVLKSKTEITIFIHFC